MFGHQTRFFVTPVKTFMKIVSSIHCEINDWHKKLILIFYLNFQGKICNGTSSRAQENWRPFCGKVFETQASSSMHIKGNWSWNCDFNDVCRLETYCQIEFSSRNQIGNGINFGTVSIYILVENDFLVATRWCNVLPHYKRKGSIGRSSTGERTH